MDSVDVPDAAPDAAPASDHGSKGPDPRQAALIASLRARYAIAEQRQDADAKRALFKEAAYLGIRPDAYRGSSSAA
jgi:hypothetical protein